MSSSSTPGSSPPKPQPILPKKKPPTTKQIAELIYENGIPLRGGWSGLLAFVRFTVAAKSLMREDAPHIPVYWSRQPTCYRWDMIMLLEREYVDLKRFVGHWGAELLIQSAIRNRNVVANRIASINVTAAFETQGLARELALPSRERSLTPVARVVVEAAEVPAEVPAEDSEDTVNVEVPVKSRAAASVRVQKVNKIPKGRGKGVAKGVKRAPATRTRR
ncbi:hypothetical protein B0J12DRAFT_702418 [Macrophomina phaseolina]|uniref:Uncharacterized protein n=1 Tax=Macrophomina phaseolina TaxID=35725 RepID=A0ABQ8G1V1_9PEZI|nr:hypothetical protein B0J12DRAFT_702418 [Macrophomina phaseolina]